VVWTIAEGLDKGRFGFIFKAGAAESHEVDAGSGAAGVLAGRSATLGEGPPKTSGGSFVVRAFVGEVLMPNRRFQKKIDTVHWQGFANSFTALGAGVVASTVGSAQHLPETILRIRGEWAADIDGTVAEGVGAFITAGLILVPEGTGATVLWSPFTDSDAPWMWWDVFNLLYDETVTDVIGSQQTLSRHRVIDSKAMRKVRNTELQLVAENTTGQGAINVNIMTSARVLAGS